jgi:hypothetical protein
VSLLVIDNTPPQVIGAAGIMPSELLALPGQRDELGEHTGNDSTFSGRRPSIHAGSRSMFESHQPQAINEKAAFGLLFSGRLTPCIWGPDVVHAARAEGSLN